MIIGKSMKRQHQGSIQITARCQSHLWILESQSHNSCSNKIQPKAIDSVQIFCQSQMPEPRMDSGKPEPFWAETIDPVQISNRKPDSIARIHINPAIFTERGGCTYLGPGSTKLHEIFYTPTSNIFKTFAKSQLI